MLIFVKAAYGELDLDITLGGLVYVYAFVQISLDLILLMLKRTTK